MSHHDLKCCLANAQMPKRPEHCPFLKMSRVPASHCAGELCVHEGQGDACCGSEYMWGNASSISGPASPPQRLLFRRELRALRSNAPGPLSTVTAPHSVRLLPLHPMALAPPAPLLPSPRAKYGNEAADNLMEEAHATNAIFYEAVMRALGDTGASTQVGLHGVPVL